MRRSALSIWGGPLSYAGAGLAGDPIGACEKQFRGGRAKSKQNNVTFA